MSFMDDPFRWSAKCGVSVLDMLIFQGQVKEFIKMEKNNMQLLHSEIAVC